jgi:tetratricopeptide (TPR) repeat protein
LGRYEEAETCQRRAIAIDSSPESPESPDDCGERSEAWYNLAAVLTARRSYADAVAALAQARTLAPQMPEVMELEVKLAGLPWKTETRD